MPDDFLKRLNDINDHLVALATPMSKVDALLNEDKIMSEAAKAGIPVGDGEKGDVLVRLEQETRLKQSGIRFGGKSQITTYVLPPDPDSVLTELVLDYTETGELRRAYTRSVGRDGRRLSVQVSPENAMKLEMFFGARATMQKHHMQAPNMRIQP